MASVDDLGGTAAQILALFAEQLAAQGVDVPKRQYVLPALMVAWDGPQLTVGLAELFQGQPGAPFGGTFTPPTAIVFGAMFVVDLLRKVPALSGEGTAGMLMPSALDLNAAGQSLMTDAKALLLAGVTIRERYTLTGPGQGFAVGSCAPVGPEGGLAGSRLQITVSLS